MGVERARRPLSDGGSGRAYLGRRLRKRQEMHETGYKYRYSKSMGNVDDGQLIRARCGDKSRDMVLLAVRVSAI